MAKKDSKLWIDMCAGSELKDTQGETLSVDGADISDLEFGKGRFNDNHGKGFFNSLGVVTEAKKIYKSEDCEDDRQKYYWEKIKAPYIYAKGYLYNDEDHPNAKAAAAIIRNIHRNDVPLKMKASVEGGVMARSVKDHTRLARTKIHSVALTFTPANNATLVEPLNLNKSDIDWEKDKRLIKSVIHLAETNVPSFRHIERHASAHTIYDNIKKIQELAKSLDIEIEIEDTSPESLIKNAVFCKINNNINKINNLLKAMNTSPGVKYSAYKQLLGGTQTIPDTTPKPQNNTLAITPTQNNQQNMGNLNNEPVSPTKPIDVNSNNSNMQVKNAAQVKNTNIFKQHASRAMKNPQYVNTVIRSLKNSGADQAKIDKVISKIKSHMAKSEDEVKESQINKSRDYIKSKFKKALMAGYGGAGAPTANVGGGVIQRESVEGSKKSETSDGFSYVSCDNCGHEQVYMAHQVKCRKCKKNFPLEKLQDKVK
jgi:hypothetical protein